MKMTTKESLKYQLLAAQCGFGFEILYTIFWGWMAYNLPPASPNLSAQAFASHFALHHNAILFGNSMAALVGVLWIPWTAQLTIVMCVPAIWATAAFRPEMEPSTIRTLNDLGFILFNITYAATSVQAIAAGLVGLADESARPVFPRWVSGWAIFAGISFVPLTVMPFFKTGPLAWNGAISFWALFGTYFFWTSSMGICMAKDASRRLREESDLNMPRKQKLGSAIASA